MRHASPAGGGTGSLTAWTRLATAGELLGVVDFAAACGDGKGERRGHAGGSGVSACGGGRNGRRHKQARAVRAASISPQLMLLVVTGGRHAQAGEQGRHPRRRSSSARWTCTRRAPAASRASATRTESMPPTLIRHTRGPTASARCGQPRARLPRWRRLGRHQQSASAPAATGSSPVRRALPPSHAGGSLATSARRRARGSRSRNSPRATTSSTHSAGETPLRAGLRTA